MDNKRITKVYLLSTPLESDYKHTLYFNSKAGQETYFKSKVVKEYTNFSYQRKDGYIRVPEHFDNLQNVNYVMYQNSAYSNKWFYAFITDIKYIDDGRTDIYIETDVIQTWYFDYSVKPSFVEREHVSDDTVGLHTIPEGLETGEYIRQTFNSNSAEDYFNEAYTLATSYICVAMSYIPPSVSIQPGGVKQYNGVYSGLLYVVFKTPRDLDRFINDIQDDITEDIIYSIFMIPSKLCEVAEADWITPTGKEYSFLFYPFTEKEVEIGGYGLTKPEFLDLDYTPKNNKLLTYPYTFLLVNNYAGSVKEYRYEFFNEYVIFNVLGAISPGCAIKLFPVGYNVTNPYPDNEPNINYVEGLDGGKLPTCSWFNDSYTNWLTQNAVNIPLNIITSVGGVVGGAVTGNVGAIAGGLSGITNQVASIYEHSLAPITAKGGVNQGDLNFAMKNTFGFYKMSIRKEYAEIIDKYFDMFGYKVNMVKTPNIHHRGRYWYTKTIDVNIDGAIPMNDMAKIKGCYNNGITFWRNGNEIGDYSLANPIRDIV